MVRIKRSVYRIRKICALVKIYGPYCFWCNRRFSKEDLSSLYIDHYVARYHGGSDDISNLRPACFHCNGSKNYSTFEEWLKFITEQKKEASWKYRRFARIYKKLKEVIQKESKA